MRRLVAGLGLILLAAVTSQPAIADKFTTLHSFCADSGCSDGSQPIQIMLDSRGNLIGPAFTGQNESLHGTLFQLQPKSRRLKVLHAFCSHVKRHCLDGSFAFSAPTMDSQGNLFGGTELGGIKDHGILYKMTPRHNGYDFKVIYNFCTTKGCPDGKGNDGGFAIDTAGNIYGTSFSGGAHGDGVFFELSPNGNGWIYNALYSFCSQKHCADGGDPLNGVTYVGASSGVPYDGVSPLYGATSSGGANDASGVVYQLTPSESGWSEKVLYTFCPNENCQNGAQPAGYGPLAFDGAGNIYGATEGGGANSSGVIYKLTPTGSGEWNETVLQDFCPQPSCIVGFNLANPIRDTAGNLFGTTSGMLYKLDMTSEQPTLTVLHQFCSLANCADGSGAESGVVMDDAAHLYGTTVSGGATGNGTIFEYKL